MPCCRRTNRCPPRPAPPPPPTITVPQLQQQKLLMEREMAALNQRLAAANSEVEKERANRLATTETLQAKIDELTKLLKERDLVIRKTQQDHAATRQELNQLKASWASRVAFWEEQIEELTRELHQTHGELLQEKKKNEANQLLNDVIKGLNLAVQDITKELVEARAELQKARAEREEAERELTRLRDSLQTLSAALLLAAGTIVGLHRKVGELTKELQDKRDQNDKLEREVALAQEQIRALKVTNANLEALNAELQQTNDEAERKAIQEAMEARERELRLEREGLILSAEIQRMQMAADLCAQLHEAELKLAASEFEDARRLTREERERANQLAKETAALKALLDATTGEVNELRRALAEAEIEVAERDRQVRYLEQEVMTHETKASQLKLDLEATQKERDEARRVVTTIKKVAIVSGVALASAGLGFLAYGLFAAKSGEKVTLPPIDPSKYKVVVENERRHLISGWGKKLFPTDRSAWTKADCTDEERSPDKFELQPGESWTGNWSVLPIGDSDGWIYAFNFPSSYYTDNFRTAFVRRRVHIRPYSYKDVSRKAPVDGGIYHIRPKHATDKVFGCISGKSGNGTLVVLYNRDGSLNQRWRCAFRGDGCVSFTPLHNIHVKLDLNGPLGASSHIWDTKDPNNDNQWLRLTEAVGDPGYFCFVRPRDNAILEVKNGGTGNGSQLSTTLVTQPANCQPHQLFWFEPL